MGRYRKKPVEIEAVQLPVSLAPAWLADAMDAGTAELLSDGTARIITLEGIMTAARGDWIICGIKGELYPCKPDVFAASYEVADSATSIALNQVVLPAAVLKREDSVLETMDGAADRFENLGPPVKTSPYKPPKDPRVQQLLKDAAAARAAENEQAAPREVFTDPRLKPGYKAKKK